jgi:hypothetical protein
MVRKKMPLDNPQKFQKVGYDTSIPGAHFTKGSDNLLPESPLFFLRNVSVWLFRVAIEVRWMLRA